MTRKCTLPSCENTSLLQQEKQPRIHFSWKVNTFFHSIIIAHVSCCFRLTSQCSHRTTQPDLSYLCTQGRKKTAFFPLGSAVVLDFSHFMSMLNCAVSALLWQLHLYFSFMTGLKHMMLWPQIGITIELQHHTISFSACNFRSALGIGSCKLQIFMHVTGHATGLVLFIGKSGRAIGASSV